jgi:hypothetical protein
VHYVFFFQIFPLLSFLFLINFKGRNIQNELPGVTFSFPNDLEQSFKIFFNIPILLFLIFFHFILQLFCKLSQLCRFFLFNFTFDILSVS